MPGIALLLLQGEALLVQRRRASIVTTLRQRLGKLVRRDVNPDAVVPFPISAQGLVEDGDGALDLIVVVEADAEAEQGEVRARPVAERFIELQTLLEQRHGAPRIALHVGHETGDIQSISAGTTGSSLLQQVAQPLAAFADVASAV